MENLNFIALIVGALVPMIVGFLWYGPILGKAWQKSLGFSDEDIQSGNMAVTFGVSYLVALLISFYLQYIVGLHEGTEDANFLHAAFHGAMSAVMTAVPVLISNSLFQKNNWTNIIINVVYWIITFALMAGVISLFLF